MNLILTKGILDVYQKRVFDNVNSFDDLLYEIEKYRLTFSKTLENIVGNNNNKMCNKIKESSSNHLAGSLFEIFVIGYLILKGKHDPLLNVKDIVSTDIITEDNGIDVYAKTTNPKLIALNRNNVNIQIKYTSDHKKEYGLRELSTFLFQAMLEGNARYMSNTIFITNGKGVNYKVKNHHAGKPIDGVDTSLTVINGKHFQSVLHNAGSFWEDLRNLIKESAEYILSTDIGKFEFDNREYQNEVIENVHAKFQTDNKVTTIIPTGGGKTVIGARIIKDVFENGGNIAAIHAPSILLTSQFSNYLHSVFGNKCDFLRICSDADRDISSLSEVISLHENEIQISILQSILTNRKLIVIVTYQSYKKFYNIMNNLNLSVDIGIFDEAHNIVHGGNSSSSDNNWKTFKQIQDKKLCDRMLMVTATPYYDKNTYVGGKICSPSKYPINLKDTASMNNIFRFGETITVPTKRILDEGYILPTKLVYMNSHSKIIGLDKNYVKHVITTVCDQIDKDNISKSDYVMNRPTVDDVYYVLFVMDKLYNEVKTYDKDNKVKIVYPTSSTTVAHALNIILTEIISNMKVKNKIFNEEIYIDSMSSDKNQMNSYSKGGTRDNIILEMEKDKHCIIIHYDMLSEGINIPSITAIIRGREMCDTKAIQTNGRAVRLDPSDMELVLKAHEMGKKTLFSPKNKSFREQIMKKPYAYFCIQLTGDKEQQIETVRNQMKIYKGLTDFVYGEIEYSTPGKINESDEDKKASKVILDEIEHLIHSIPTYDLETEEFSTYLKGSEEDTNITPELLLKFSKPRTPPMDLREILDKEAVNVLRYGTVSIEIDKDNINHYRKIIDEFENEMKFISCSMEFNHDTLSIILDIRK